jgi:hypothetical protein
VSGFVGVDNFFVLTLNGCAFRNGLQMPIFIHFADASRHCSEVGQGFVQRVTHHTKIICRGEARLLNEIALSEIFNNIHKCFTSIEIVTIDHNKRSFHSVFRH